MMFENVDVTTALKYLRITGGDDHINEIGLKKIAPRWIGPRPDLITVGGDSISDDTKWTKLKRQLTSNEIRVVVARVIETAILVCMSTHIYSFGPDLYLQCAGVSIGMRFTASLANLIMKQWDKSWVRLLEREKLDFDLFIRYVDDCRLFMRSLNPGWHWNGEKFAYSSKLAQEDEEQGVSFEQRTTREVTKAMCDMTNFPRFTGEDCSMFSDRTLPTLDTSIWVEDSGVKHKFFEKPTVGNQVLNKETALPTSSLRSSLLQEAVRRLQNCSVDLNIESKQEILSVFGQKLINSGHSRKSARIILVQGVIKFLWKLGRSTLPEDDPKYKPLYLAKEYCEEERQITKYQARMNWFRRKRTEKDERDDDESWRDNLKGVWRGSITSQRLALKTGFSTVLNVPNTKGAVLANKLIENEFKIAKMSRYNVKIIEMSGVQLIRMFQRVYAPKTCHWQNCPVCCYNSSKGSSKCRLSNVVYEARCLECSEQVEKDLISESDVGVYIGETSRTLVERAMEHVKSAENLDIENFITKHWALRHKELEVHPRMQFRVVKHCKDAISRQVTEAIWIESEANLNSKSEWGRNHITRLKVDDIARGGKDAMKSSNIDEETVQEFKYERLKKRRSKGSSQDDKCDHAGRMGATLSPSKRTGEKVDSCRRGRPEEDDFDRCAKKRRIEKETGSGDPIHIEDGETRGKLRIHRENEKNDLSQPAPELISSLASHLILFNDDVRRYEHSLSLKPHVVRLFDQKNCVQEWKKLFRPESSGENKPVLLKTDKRIKKKLLKKKSSL